MNSSDQILIPITPDQNLSANYSNYLNNSDTFENSTHSVNSYLNIPRSDFLKITVPVMIFAITLTVHIINSLTPKLQEQIETYEKKQLKKLLNILYHCTGFYIISIGIWFITMWFNFLDEFSNIQIIILVFGLFMVLVSITIHHRASINEKVIEKSTYNKHLTKILPVGIRHRQNYIRKRR